MESKMYSEAEVMEYAISAVEAYKSGFKKGNLEGCLIATAGIVIISTIAYFVKKCKEEET